MKFSLRIIQLAIFLIVGELLFRFDKATNFFGHTNIVITDTSIAQTNELRLVNSGKIPLNDSVLRIMVLGDSYIYGVGMDSNKKFSSRLKELLATSTLGRYKQTLVLDVSRPANNTLNNCNIYFAFSKQFKPQLVILCYNIDDVEGDLDNAPGNAPATHLKIPGEVTQNLRTIDKLYDFIFKSELLRISLVNINSYLKAHGIIVINTQFDTELKYYLSYKPQWHKSKKLLDSMFSDGRKNNVEFIVFLMPQVNLLEYPQVFKSADLAISQYFGSKENVKFINGRTIFDGQKSKDLILSKYDGHPNEKAHEYLAKYFYNFLQMNK